MRKTVDPGKDGFSFGAWVWDRGTGMILDTRGNNGGFTVMLGTRRAGDKEVVTRRRPTVCMLTKPHVFGPTLSLTPQGAWHYIGLTADNRTGEAVFYVDDQAETVRFEAPVPRPLKGVEPHVGAKSLPASAVRGLSGSIRFAALYAGPKLGPEHHRWLQNQFAEELGQPKLDGATEPACSPIMWMDPADKAGIKSGDVIISVNGKKVSSSRDLSLIVANASVEKRTVVTVLRGDNERKIYVNLTARQDSGINEKQGLKDTDDLGLKLAELEPETASRLGFSEDEKGVLVTHVQPDGKGALAGIKQGDLIKEINHKTVNTIRDYRRQMGEVKSGDTLQILIKRANAGLVVVTIGAMR